MPGARARAEAGELAFGTVDTWLIWNLTSGKIHVTDPTNASRTLLYNIVEGQWDDDLLKLLRIPASMMPEVVWSSEKIGAGHHLARPRCGRDRGHRRRPAGRALRPALRQARHAKNTYGTGCFLLQNIGDNFVLSEKRLITTSPAALAQAPEYALEGSVFIGGAVVQWLRDDLNLIRSRPMWKQLAASVTDSGGVMLRARIRRPGRAALGPLRARAAHRPSAAPQPGHIARAALEGIAFQVADVLDAMDAETETSLQRIARRWRRRRQ